MIYENAKDLTNAGPANFYIDLVGNVIIFVPFAAAIHFLGYKKTTDISKILIILATSICIEVIQYIYNIGVFDVDDILLNLLGGITGIYLFNFGKKFF